MGKSLAEKNIHLQNADNRKHTMTRNIVSSSAIEGIWLKRDTRTGRFVSKGQDGVPSKVTSNSE